MSDNEVPDARRRRNQRLGWGSGLLAAGAIGGAVLAGTLPASAATRRRAPRPGAPAPSSRPRVDRALAGPAVAAV